MQCSIFFLYIYISWSFFTIDKSFIYTYIRVLSHNLTGASFLGLCSCRCQWMKKCSECPTERRNTTRRVLSKEKLFVENLVYKHYFIKSSVSKIINFIPRREKKSNLDNFYTKSVSRVCGVGGWGGGVRGVNTAYPYLSIINPAHYFSVGYLVFRRFIYLM